MVSIVKMAIIAGLVNADMTMNMVFLGVFSKSSKNADQLRKRFVNPSNSKKVMTKTKFSSEFWPFPLYFGPIFRLAWGTLYIARIWLKFFLVATLSY